MNTFTNRYPDDRDRARVQQELDVLRASTAPPRDDHPLDSTAAARPRCGGQRTVDGPPLTACRP
ncbi:hypothetical protein [Arsenicicoccus sp. oral taxon 190]|uniref:hypothetical protein n=1 Tax=Arsenicicoccus sp. oral taxon 190 TaxID=1658671 RepID=UPI0012E1A971|nr:hypothetical protein [Arsenicicoccus sp. oral taxon 190]